MSQTRLSVDNLLEYLRSQEKLRRLSEEAEYLDKLLEISRKRLSIRDLERYSRYLSKIRKRLENLNAERESLLEKIRSVMPPYKRYVEIADRIIKLFYRLKENTDRDPTLLDEILPRLGDVTQKASEALKNLKSASKSLKAIIESGKITEDAYIKMLEEELQQIENSAMLLGRIANMLSVIGSLESFWELLGFFVVQREPRSFLGIATDVVISPKTLAPLIEVSAEEPIPEELLTELFKEVGADFKARNPEEFIDNLHDRVRNLLGVETDITPSLLERIFESEDVVIPRDIAKKIKHLMRPKYYVKAFSARKNADLRGSVILVDRGDFVFAEEESVDNLPSLKPLPKEFMLKEITYGRYTYVIWNGALLPKLGYSAILLRRDESKNPIPDPAIVRKILAWLRKLEESPIKLGKDKKLEKMSEERVLWILRVAIVRGIGEEYDVTESDALIPRNLFQFCLKYRIPITYEDLLLSYFYACPTNNLVRKNVSIEFRAKKKPTLLKHLLTEDQLVAFVGANNIPFSEIIGYTIPKKGSIYVKGIRRLNERRILLALKETVGIPASPEIIKKAKGRVKKIIEFLIYAGKISTFDQYKGVLRSLGVESLPYNDVVKSFAENPKKMLLKQLLSLL